MNSAIKSNFCSDFHKGSCLTQHNPGDCTSCLTHSVMRSLGFPNTPRGSSSAGPASAHLLQAFPPLPVLCLNLPGFSSNLDSHWWCQQGLFLVSRAQLPLTSVPGLCCTLGCTEPSGSWSNCSLRSYGPPVKMRRASLCVKPTRHSSAPSIHNDLVL